MKKTYKNPTTESVNIEMSQMIAASGGPESTTLDIGGDLDTALGAESRRGSSLWDDDEE